MIEIRNDEPPFDDVRVRKAMSLAIDQAEFNVIMKSESLPLDFFPFAPGDPAYTPLEELPEDIQALYGYDPDEAKRLLAEAGYPDGFTTKIWIEPSPIELVELELNQVDEVTFVAETYPLPIPEYHGCVLGCYSAADPLRTFISDYVKESAGNVDCYYNSEFEAICRMADKELDEAEKTRLVKEAGAILREEWLWLDLDLKAEMEY
jgi:peptide/nickel transport system substrate-binding protein